ncbi:MAG: [Fe-Fe] hydrogenase large subunit C-terminal domain-containing protein [Ruminococcus sp.]|nr:[Fe-Fe] hydrogenase large subunit C-terminal domain-containing protein [Ruminococcus sp.]
MDEVFTNSVRLDPDLCKGCINCLKRCPTQAIRVRGGKAHITKDFCIDCGECIRVCPHHAKKAFYEPLDVINNYKYTVALPAPSFYAQFNNLDDTNIVLRALKRMGFDDVYEVSAAAELVSELTRDYIEKHRENAPFISVACPSVVRLIQVKFPNLIEHLLKVNSPVEIAASEAKRIAMEKTGLSAEDIGVIFISPCPAKVTSVKNPLGYEKSEIDAVIAIKEVYPKILPLMLESVDDNTDFSCSGKIGLSWGASGGEASGLLIDNYLAADGIENVIKVLEDLEDQKISNLEFIELNACSGGCVGGVLQVENPYVAKSKLKQLRKYMPVSKSHIGNAIPCNSYITDDIEYKPVFNLGKDFADGLEKMEQMEEIYQRLPGLDCGSCGAPTCKALAEDVVRGIAKEKDCVHLLREYIHKMTNELGDI